MTYAEGHQQAIVQHPLGWQWKCECGSWQSCPMPERYAVRMSLECPKGFAKRMEAEARERYRNRPRPFLDVACLFFGMAGGMALGELWKHWPK
jgi:hypothetical protein